MDNSLARVSKVYMGDIRKYSPLYKSDSPSSSPNLTRKSDVSKKLEDKDKPVNNVQNPDKKNINENKI